MPAERLQKIIAAAGIASRRKAEELITAGLVSVNGHIVTELGTKADSSVDSIKVNGRPLGAAERHVYLLLNKPKGYVTTVTDPEGRPTVLDLVRGVKGRVYPVGRLDYLSEGLLLLTNDGELAQKLTHASSHVPKTYLVKISGKPDDAEVAKLRSGLFLPAELTPLKSPEALQKGRPARRRSKAVRTAPIRIKLVREAANPAHVRADWAPRGKDQACSLWSSGTGRRTGQAPPPHFGRSEALEVSGEFRHARLKDPIVQSFALIERAQAITILVTGAAVSTV